jgi:hypothetical protein
VLGPDAPLVKNLAAMWAADQALAEQIESLHPLAPYPVEPSKAGPPTVVVTPAAAADSPGRRRQFGGRTEQRLSAHGAQWQRTGFCVDTTR